jgi:hypothetical protein
MWSRLTLSTVVVAAAVFAIAAGVRLSWIAREPFFVDEAFSARFSSDSPARMLDLTARDTHPPLYYLGLSAWRRFAGDSVGGLRSFSVAWSLIGLAALALLARQLVGDRGGEFAVLAAAAVHPLDVQFAQTARMYSQFAALSTLAAWLLWRWMSSTRTREKKKTLGWAAAYGAVAILLLHTHYLAPVFLVAQGIFALAYFACRCRWADFGVYLGCAAAAAVAFLPWLVRVLHFRDGLYSESHLRWIPVPKLGDGVGMLFHELVSGRVSFGMPWSMFMSWAAVGCVAGAALLILRSVVRPAIEVSPDDRAPYSLRAGYAAWLLFGPVALALGVSWIYQPILYPPRFAVVVLPPFLILLGLAVAEIRSVRWKGIAVAALAVLLVSSSAVETVAISTAGVEDFVRLWETGPAPDRVAFFPAYAAKTASYYLGKRLRSATRKEVESVIAAGLTPRLWVCTTRDWRPAVPADSDYRDWLLAQGRNRVLIHTDTLEVIQVQIGRAEEPPPAAAPVGGS